MITGIYKYNFVGETKHIMFLVYVQVNDDSYLSYYYEDYEGGKIISTLSTNLSAEEFKEIKNRTFRRIDVTDAPKWLKEFAIYKIEKKFSNA